MMTEQEVFNVVAEHLLRQGERSRLGHSGCAYRGDNGKKCAVGALIKDEYYNRGLEWYMANNPQVMAALQLSGVSAINCTGILLALQSCHDTTAPEFWADKLRRIARYFSLNEDIIDSTLKELGQSCTTQSQDSPSAP